MMAEGDSASLAAPPTTTTKKTTKRQKTEDPPHLAPRPSVQKAKDPSQLQHLLTLTCLLHSELTQLRRPKANLLRNATRLMPFQQSNTPYSGTSTGMSSSRWSRRVSSYIGCGSRNSPSFSSRFFVRHILGNVSAWGKSMGTLCIVSRGIERMILWNC
jgi:hypothetical protein